ncbi:MAG: VPLPA-CTERM sorting domain-containing protein [Hyphomicrobiales bacterium]|nr:VPLPA-CTERM sorting domain-containing protein [Hyphomicrobiales bacterium]
MKNLVKLVLVSVFASAASVASAATLDLTANGSGNQGSQIVLGDATVDLITGSYLHVGDFDPNTVCSYTGFSGCVGSFSITWNYDVANVNFDYGYGNTGDSAVVQAFDAFNALVGSVLLNLTSGTSNIDISGLGVFRSLVFDTTAATGAGYSFGNIEFDRVAAVPLPAGGLLLLGGLGGLAALRRRKKSVTA